MAFTITLGGVTLPDPRRENPIEIEFKTIGNWERMQDGTLRAQFTAQKAVINMHFEQLTSSERSTLYTQWAAARYTSAALVIPSGSFTVMSGMGSWQQTPIHLTDGSTVLYDVSIQLDEV